MLRISANLKIVCVISDSFSPPPTKSSKSQAICPGSKQITNRITIMASVLITWMFSFLLLSAGKEL